MFVFSLGVFAFCRGCSGVSTLQYTNVFGTNFFPKSLIDQILYKMSLKLKSFQIFQALCHLQNLSLSPFIMSTSHPFTLHFPPGPQYVL